MRAHGFEWRAMSLFSLVRPLMQAAVATPPPRCRWLGLALLVGPLYSLSFCAAAPFAGSSRLQTYLTRFGYLPRNEPGTDNLFSLQAIQDALVKLQRFAHVTPSGELDDDTLELLMRKRCGLPDLGVPPPRRRRSASRWHRLQLSYSNHHNLLDRTFSVAGYASGLGPGRVRRIVHDALHLWSGVSALEFLETADRALADIVVDFASGDHGDGYPFDGRDVVLAHAFYPGPGLGGDVHFDLDEIWSEGGEGRSIQLFAVAAHEFGHAIGLAHSNYSDSLMYPFYRPYFQHNFSLPMRDVYDVQQLYGSGGAQPVPRPSPPAITTLPPDVTSTSQDIASTPPTPPLEQPMPPQPCAGSTKIDAVAFIRNEIFVFSGSYFWRLDAAGYLLERPIQITRFWYGLPADFRRFDAAYEAPSRNLIRFFSGRQYWEFRANYAEPQSPRPLTALGLPSDVDRIDAAFVWGFNHKTYLFAEPRYWVLDEETMRVEPDYPRQTRRWKGLPANVDAAYTDKNDSTYFIKGHLVYSFNGRIMQVERGWPKTLAHLWGECRGEQPRARAIRSDVARDLVADAPPVKQFNVAVLCIPIICWFINT